MNTKELRFFHTPLRQHPLSKEKIRNTAEDGNATAEFVMVSALAVLFFALVLQITFAIYTRNILIDAASTGARYGALLDRNYSDGAQRTRDIIASELPAVYSSEVSYQLVTVDGYQTLEIRVHGALPVVGPFGFEHGIDVAAHAIVPTPEGT
ncbi:TadE/TadG family type IV pilus assembly protein [Rothia sp. P6271]|uniref:TadE/TadG family type IV pilus assembly protein n=1 Tax=Rothia sp. P6271 TaxID=3402659 RepID=UPI003AC0550D